MSNSNSPGDKILRSGDLAMIVRADKGLLNGEAITVGTELIGITIRVERRFYQIEAPRKLGLLNPACWTYSESSRPLVYKFGKQTKIAKFVPEAILIKISDGTPLQEKLEENIFREFEPKKEVQS